MSKGTKVLLVVMLVLISLGVIGGCSAIGWNNQAVRLESQFEAQQKSNEVEYDKVWKVIAQVAQIASEHKDAFKEIFIGIMEKRYSGGNGGKMMLWIKEQNPNFDASLYKKVQSTVEGQRESFARNQKQLLDIKREHDNLRKEFPSSLVCGGRKELVAVLVTSGKTKKAFETGEENDVELFKKK